MAGTWEAQIAPGRYNGDMDVAISLPRCFEFRPLRRGERGAVSEVFSGLGERSRRLRFGGPKPSLPEPELRWLADVDGSRHAAVVAVDCEGAAVGIARFVRVDGAPPSAELAFAVVDEWQGRGIGKRLLAALVEHARRTGIERFVATVHAGNQASLRLLRHAGPVVSSTVRDGDYELVVDLGPSHLEPAA
jgi:RimJ/RimL family protein N-acetyltransferase